MIMKQGSMGMGQVIKAIIIILVVFVILFWAGPAYSEIREALGFDVSLTPAEIDSQELAKEEFDKTFIHALNDCASGSKIRCFCLEPGSFSLPTDYQLIFSPEQGDIRIDMNNHKGGEVLTKWVSGVDPCVSLDNNSLVMLSGEAKSSTIKMIFSSENKLTYIDLNGKEVSERVDSDYYIYKPNKDSLCLLKEKTARLKNKEICI